MNSHFFAADIISEIGDEKERNIMKELSYSKWFALLATMAALLVFGIMAGCSNPTGTNPGSSTATATKIEVVTKQWEAKKILQQIYKMELAYHENHDFYWPYGGSATASASRPDAFATIGIKIMPNARYSYYIDGLHAVFTAVATCYTLDDDRTGDVWTMNDLGQLVVISDDAAD